MLDEKKLKSHFKWMAENGWCWEYPETTIGGFWEIVGDDRDGLEKVLSGMDADELWAICGLFDDISEKWPDRKMDKFLSGLSKKIKDAGYQP